MSRNLTRGEYDPKRASEKARIRRVNAKYQGKKIVGNNDLRSFVDKYLLGGQSPEDISGRLKNQQKKLPYISKESIYRYIGSIHGRKIEAKLKKKKKTGPKRKNKKTLDGRRFIDKRPNIANTRKRVGDAEFDFIVSGKSGKGILLVVVDRKLRVSFLEPIYKVSITEVHKAMYRIKKRYPEWKTGTTDNDILFRKHKQLEKEIHIRIFFCHQYHSWEKGTVENTNGEIRGYLPKGSDISKYSKSFFKGIENKINNRFMKCLDYKTPSEALAEHRKRKNLRKRRGGGHSN